MSTSAAPPLEDARALLAMLGERGVKVWLDGGTVRCRAPKGALTPALVERMRARKPEMIALLSPPDPSTAAGGAPADDGFPLSHGQRALWFLHRLAPESAAYNIMYALHLDDGIDPAHLAAAIDAIVARHPALRTVFTERAGEPVQRVRPPTTGHLAVVEGEGDVEAWAASAARAPFDLASGVVRFMLWRAPTPPRAVLLVVVHHIAADLVSLRLIIDDLERLYADSRAGRALDRAPTDDGRRQVEAERRALAADGDRLERYWVERLGGALPTLDLPCDAPRPPEQTFVGRDAPFALSKATTEGLRALARAEGVTPYMATLAAFYALLHRYTGQTDLVIGTPVDTRDHDRERIGYHVNPVVLRLSIEPEAPFTDLLARVRTMLLGALQHRAYPFPLLVERLQPERDPSRSPLFQVEFVWDQFLEPVQRQGSIVRRTLLAGQCGAEFDLSLTVFDMGATLEGAVRYNTDLFEPATIERFIEHFVVLLDAAVAQPRAPICRLPVMSPAERARLRVEWNDTAREVPTERTVSALFAEQVERTPHATAVTFTWADAPGEPERLTYAELDRRARIFRRRLEAAGAEPGARVAVLADRSPDYLAALLAILAAGAIYLPLDPRHPPRRLASVLDRSRPRVLVLGDAQRAAADAALVGRAHAPARCVLETPPSGEAPPPRSPPRCAPIDRAYVLYTSGSTGLPKGAIVEHRGMVNHLYAKIHDLGLGPRDVIAQNAPQTFDISVWQLLVALIVGGQTAIVDDDIARDPRALMAATRARGVTMLEVVPSLLGVVLDVIERSREPMSALRWLVPTGEALPPEMARRWLALHPGVPLLNAYGPTECSDDVTHHRIDAPPGPRVVDMPIGRPVGNMQMYVLDAAFELVPTGVAGELYVAGIGVGQGYLADPGRTARTFVPSPFGDGQRLYRTGDRVRWLADGTLVFLGRVDHQIKLRGFRIELGDIEATLGGHPAVARAVAVTRGAGSDMRLVAYAALRHGMTDALGPAPDDALRAHLADRLPDYMVPSAIVVLPTLPLTANGKIDREALPAPQANVAPEAAAPSTPTERAVVGVYREILRLDAVGVERDFFDLGGHSLLATRLLARVHEATGVEIPLRAFFTASSVAGLARQIDRVRLARGLSAPITDGTGEHGTI